MTISATFPLIEEPAAPEATPGVGAMPLASIEERSLLGYGLLTPFRRDRLTDFAAGGGVELVRSAVSQVLGVRADDGRMTGELPWRPEFGSLLDRLRFRAADESFGSLARSRVIGAIEQWEPRARVKSVSVRRTTDAQGQPLVLIRVGYDIVQTGTENVLARNLDLDVPLPT